MVLSDRQQRLSDMRDGMVPGARPAAIVPRTFAEAHAMCIALAQADLVPKAFRQKPSDMLLVVMTGSEVGIPPMAALRLYTTWDGVPRLMAEGVRGVMLSHPETIEYFEVATCDDKHATWIGKRRGRPEKSATWTIERAKRAKLTEKPVWMAYPEDMLNARASMQLARMLAPDIVAGMRSTEEARDGDFIEAEFTETINRAAPAFVAPPQGAPPGVPMGRAPTAPGPELRAAIGQVQQPAASIEPPKRGPGRPPKDQAAPRPTTTPPAASGSGASSAASTQTGDPGPSNLAAAIAKVEEKTASPTPAASVESATSSSPGVASESTGGEIVDAFADDAPDAPAPADDVEAKLVEFRAWVAGCKTQRELRMGLGAWQAWTREMSEKRGDIRFRKEGELTREVSELYSTRKAQVPA